MTRISVLAASLLLAACSGDIFANAKTLRTQATEGLVQKNYGIAAEKAYAATIKAPKDAEGFYLLAQAQAQLGRKNAAMASLETAIANGFTDEEAIKGNANLAPLRNAEAYKELMAATFPPAAAPAADGAAPAAEGAAAPGTAPAQASSEVAPKH
ncbi:TPR end-of-group domain-containing protein [Pseudoduganella sp. OTU4001]|uniref:TPR end-of-group domain-containing protein n=1 Tax=Pseudoduganella sp. OTU4001 TaxID=3043854 RepID=UPI00313C035F